MSRRKNKKLKSANQDLNLPVLNGDPMPSDQALDSIFSLQHGGFATVTLPLVGAISTKMSEIDFFEDLPPEVEETYQSMVREVSWALSGQILRDEREIDEVLERKRYCFSPYSDVCIGSERFARDVTSEVKRLLSI